MLLVAPALIDLPSIGENTEKPSAVKVEKKVQKIPKEKKTLRKDGYDLGVTQKAAEAAADKAKAAEKVKAEKEALTKAKREAVEKEKAEKEVS